MDVDPTLLQVFLKDFPSHPTSEFPQDWELTIPSPPTPNRLGPFRPVAGSSAIYSLFRRDDGDPDSTHTKVFTLCCHIPISKPIAHPSDPEGEILDVVAMIADTGREVWGLCEWKEHPGVPGAVLGTFSKLIGFRRRNTVPGSDDIIAVLFEGLPFAPDTEALLRPAPDYASLTSFLIPTSQNEAGIDAPNLPSIPLQGPRHYPWTRATSASLSGVVTYLFYDRNSDENAPPIAPPYAGMHVMFRKENNPVECSTAIQITEVGNQVIGLSDLRKFKGWIGRAETSVLLSRVEEDGFIGTILEAHPGTLPNGKPCISGLVTFRINRGGRSLSS